MSLMNAELVQKLLHDKYGSLPICPDGLSMEEQKTLKQLEGILCQPLLSQPLPPESLVLQV